MRSTSRVKLANISASRVSNKTNRRPGDKKNFNKNRLAMAHIMGLAWVKCRDMAATANIKANTILSEMLY